MVLGQKSLEWSSPNDDVAQTIEDSSNELTQSRLLRGSWWAELAIHADISDGGSLEVAVYFG